MKQHFFLIVLAFLFVGCNSIQRYNAHISESISPEKLKKDVDLTQSRLRKMHPNLYYYITKDDLDRKFDSVRNSISCPMTSIEFYKKISPVIASVRQGHMFVYPPTRKYTKKETVMLAKKGIGPLSQFDFEFFDNRLYVVKNKSYDKSIKVGTEVVTLNSKSPQSLFDEYKNRFTSDGFNTTFKSNFFERRFSQFFTYESGIVDSILYNVKWNDSLKSIKIKRQIVDSTALKQQLSKHTITAAEKQKIQADRLYLKRNKSLLGYDPTLKAYNRNLTFLEKDSSIAVMKIKAFSKGKYKRFYKQAFQRIQRNQSSTLIIDLRNNGGGRLAEIVELYKYLADSTFVFMEKSEVTSRSSLVNHYFRGGSLLSRASRILTAPIAVPFIYILVHKDQDGKYYLNHNTHPQKIKKTPFKGKVYVLINGGSFSASSVLAANLKGDKRAVLVGQETGGAHNGTVAGQMPIIELPHSKIKIRIGLMNIIPRHKSETFGRGVFPDYEVIPTIEDRIKDVDPEMNWVLQDCKKETK